MRYLAGKLPALVGAVAATLLLVPQAGAATVAVTENDGSVRTINSPPAFSITNSTLTNPYGADVVTTPSGGILITFSPTSDFVATASNATSGQDQQTDGKLDFTLTFDNPTVLTAIISEGGLWSATGNGFTGINIGGVITETQDPVNGAQLLANSPMATFNSDNTWSAQINLGTFGQAYSSYNFSIDNLLDANAPGGNTASSASISKTSFSVYIPPPGGSGANPTPLPLAGFGGMGLGALALLVRKKLAR